MVDQSGQTNQNSTYYYQLLKTLVELLGIEIDFISDCIGDKINNAVKTKAWADTYA